MASTGFFQRQASARRNTLWLVLLFITAVLLITLAVTLVGYLVTRHDGPDVPFQAWLLSNQGLITAGAAVSLITVGSMVRWIDLAGGGDRVARMVGARLIPPDTTDADERRLRNVVEEMAIASGVPVPDLYVMDQETGINAFVAGYTPGEAVMVVTHGAVTHLNRDELQGVVGHEFSHILNGDMRINVRLIALLAGILMIGQIGGFLLRSMSYRSVGSRRDNRGQAFLAIVGLALLVIGYVGVFFGRLIQAAVSRQRETLADASSVQFTRNPEGIGSALFKIGIKGGFLEATRHASDMNHMCFGESTRMRFSGWLASHPPIEERINLIQPGLLARLRSRMRDSTPAADLTAGARAAPLEATGFSGQISSLATDILQPVQRRRGHQGAAVAPGTPALSERVGQNTPETEAFALRFLNSLPATFRDLLYTRTGAVQLCYALVVSGLPEADRGPALAALANPESQPALAVQPDLMAKYFPTLEQQGDGVRFPALELAMPALRKLDPDERAGLIRNVRTLAEADKRISLFELALGSFLQRHLGAGAGRQVPVQFRRYGAVIEDIRQLMSLMARAGTDDPNSAEALYRQAMAGFGDRQSARAPMAGRVSLKALQTSLTRLNRLSPLLKPAIIDACGECVTHDGRIDAKEYELMRLIADQLDCPMPPI